MWSCVDPTFQRFNLPFGTAGFIDDSAVDDYYFIQKGKSPPPKQLRDVDGIESLWAELRDQTISLANLDLDAQWIVLRCEQCRKNSLRDEETSR